MTIDSSIDSRKALTRHPPTTPEISARMRRVAQKNTMCELLIRSILHRRGFRFRLDTKVIVDSRCRPDLVFSRVLVAVFVDGCFWHGCPTHERMPKKNGSWWREKINGTRRRDVLNTTKLRNAGWLVVRIWEHERPARAAEKVARAVARRSKRAFD